MGAPVKGAQERLDTGEEVVLSVQALEDGVVEQTVLIWIDPRTGEITEA